jgi:NADH-quinone oxidoreductase subunit M
VAVGNERIGDLRARELVVVAPLIALLLFLGVYPKPVLNLINPAVEHTMNTIGQHDPKPIVPAGTARPAEAPRKVEGPHR